MGMPAFDLIVPSRVILLPVLGTIAAIAIIKAAVAVTIEVPVVVTIKVAVAATVVCTVPREAILVTDITEATPDGGPVHEALLTPDHLSNTTTGHDLHLNLAEGIDPIQTAEVGPDHLREGMATIPEVIMIQSLQIANTSDVLPDLPGRSDSK